MYRAVAVSAFQTQLAYRSQIWAHIFSQFLQAFFRIAIWTSVYGSLAHVDGVSLPEMITYSVLAGTVLSAWEWQRLIQNMDLAITNGDIAVFLLRPLSYPLYLLARECGNLGFRLVAVVAPVVLAVSASYGLLPPASLFHGAMFVPFWLLSFVISFLLSLLFGLCIFWLLTGLSLEWLLQGLLGLLSGSFMPLWFFPEALLPVLRYLPFAWVGFYPVAVYLGKLAPAQVFFDLALGSGWAGILALSVLLVWRKAARRISVQGG